MKVVGRIHKNTNDCWADAIAYATKKTYDEVYDSLKIWANGEGGMPTDIVEGILLANGYTIYECNGDRTIHQTLLEYNHHDNEVVIFTDGHMFYLNNKKIYDLKEYGKDYVYITKVLKIAMKEK
jgi:hypothetical protein